MHEDRNRSQPARTVRRDGERNGRIINGKVQFEFRRSGRFKSAKSLPICRFAPDSLRARLHIHDSRLVFGPCLGRLVSAALKPVAGGTFGLQKKTATFSSVSFVALHKQEM